MYAKIAEEAKSVTSSIGWKVRSIGRINRLTSTSRGATKTAICVDEFAAIESARSILFLDAKTIAL